MLDTQCCDPLFCKNFLHFQAHVEVLREESQKVHLKVAVALGASCVQF